MSIPEGINQYLLARFQRLIRDLDAAVGSARTVRRLFLSFLSNADRILEENENAFLLQSLVTVSDGHRRIKWRIYLVPQELGLEPGDNSRTLHRRFLVHWRVWFRSAKVLSNCPDAAFRFQRVPTRADQGQAGPSQSLQDRLARQGSECCSEDVTL